MLWVSQLLLEASGVLCSVCFVVGCGLPGDSLETRLAHAAHQVTVLAQRSRCCSTSGLTRYERSNRNINNSNSNQKKPALTRVQKPTLGKTQRHADAGKWHRETWCC